MPTHTVALTDFLLARIAEDEAAARGIPQGSWEDACSTTRRYDHVFRWSPTRVLAECEAKRRIVELCAPGDWTEPHWHPLGEPGEDDRGDVLALLALPYADHPDYRDEWRP